MADSAFDDVANGYERLAKDHRPQSRMIQVKESYEAQSPGEVTCSAGIFVEVVRRDVTPGWWLVRCGDQLGRIPSSHLHLTPNAVSKRADLFCFSGSFSGSFSAPNSPNLSVSGTPSDSQSPRSSSEAPSPPSSTSPSTSPSTRHRPARSGASTLQPQRDVRAQAKRSYPPLGERTTSVPSALCAMSGSQTMRGGAPYQRQRPLVRQQSDYVAMSPTLLLESSDDLYVYDWFHGMMSRIQAEYLLTTFGVHASFLVRESDNVAGRYAVSIRCGNSAQHFRIYSNKKGFFINQGDPLSPSIPSLIQRHGQVPIRGLKSKTIFLLAQPLGRSECRFSEDLDTPDGYEDMSQFQAAIGSPTHHMLSKQSPRRDGSVLKN
ncbi:SH2/SH3 adapter protein dreadlocks-like [Oscarella lobularis]|uniref:SH2/SH3 adapter protein dreadlocks-like n=1 Tax=Oscarella lobularis TaxID=121494 RepID=UPI003313245B